ncbi:MAG: hypothetical protein AAFR12_02970 [Cyanobacteria bacterium J06626_6]
MLRIHDVTFWRSQVMINDGNMGWDDGVALLVRNLKDSEPDKYRLARRLLSQDDGSLVAEGMVIVVEEAFSNGDVLLSQYATDRRWNYWMTDNSEFSKVCLLAWKLRREKVLSAAERDFLAGWEDVLEETFDIRRF